MIDAQSLSFFISASLLLAITPGPDILFVFNQSILHGARTGLIITLGLCTGLIIHSSLVALGIASLIQQSPDLFMVIQLLGVGYLFYLAWQIYHSSAITAATTRASLATNYKKLYLRGFIMNVSNPKVMMFFLAFLPQFIVQPTDIAMQISLLGLLFIMVTFVVFGGIALLSPALFAGFKGSGSWQRRLNKLSAWVIAGFSGYILINSAYSVALA